MRVAESANQALQTMQRGPAELRTSGRACGSRQWSPAPAAAQTIRGCNSSQMPLQAGVLLVQELPVVCKR